VRPLCSQASSSHHLYVMSVMPSVDLTLLAGIGPERER
jgi:hypothetical protein